VAASSVSVRSVTGRAVVEHSLEIRGFLGERQIARGALDRAGQRGDLGLSSGAFRRTGLTHGGPDSSRGGQKCSPLRPGADYFLALSAVDCLAMTWSLILSYVAAGTTFFFTRSSLRAYGRFSTIFLA